MIDLRHVNKSYLQGDTAFPVLKDINLHIDEGEFVAIMGPSGSGKTTLINMIGFLDTAFEGDYLFQNENVAAFNRATASKMRNQHVGFVFQNFNLISHQSVLENVKMPLYVKNMTDKEMVEIAERELTRLGIGDFIKKNVKQLSGGQKQRVAIARALVNNPEMIVADEPTGSLDSQSQENVLEIFKELAEAGKTVIIVTHNPEVADYADVVIKMKDGEVVETIEK